MTDNIKILTCCVCGNTTKGKQWHNRDTGFGVCHNCIKWITDRGGYDAQPDQLHSLYGVNGVHYNIEVQS